MPETAPASTGISHAKFEKWAIQYDKFLAAAEQHSMPETAPASTGISHAKFVKLVVQFHKLVVQFHKFVVQYDKFLAAAEQHSMPETARAGTGISHAQFAKSYDLHCLTLWELATEHNLHSPEPLGQSC